MAVLLLPACGEETNTPTSSSETEYVEQEVSERTFNDWTLENVGFEVPVSLGEAVFFKIYNDRLFVWDGPSMTIKRYSMDGELEATYGNGQGQGPGQFQHISSFAPVGTEEVWIVDSRTKDITRFRYDGTLVDRFRTEFKPYRMTVAGKDRLVVQRMLEPKLFALLNAEGEVLKRFGKVIDEPQDRYSLILEGQMFPNPDGGFIWAPLYASYLYFYSKDGTLERRIELIDGHRFPVEQMQPGPLQSDIEGPPQRTHGVSLTDEEIFVNVTSTEPVKEGESGAVAVLDRYDRSTGKYLDSKVIRAGGTFYKVYDGMLYGVAYSDTTLNKLRIHRSP
ncbi:MAG: hypothetical protein ABEK84_00830 [Salinibacter sp.]